MSEAAQHDALHADLAARLGESLIEGGKRQAPEPVNIPMIHHWNDAFDDRNPVYEDADFAKDTRFGGLIAPPAMMQTWCMPRPRIIGIGERGGAAEAIPESSPLSVLDRAGYTGTLATNSELEFHRPLRDGEWLWSDVIFDDISPRKKTGLGQGYFVTWIQVYEDENGEEVGRQLFRVLKFDPTTIGQ